MTARRHSFVAKLAAAVLLLGLADLLFWRQEPGWTVGLFAFAWTAALALAVKSARRRAPLIALLIAAGFGLVLVDDPSPLALKLFWTAITSAALLTRVTFDDAGRWALRLLVHGLVGLARPLTDLRRVVDGGRSGGVHAAVSLLAIPLIGGLIFALLFAAANPVIGAALGRFEIPSIGRAIFWGFVTVLVWPSFRPYIIRLPSDAIAATIRLPDLPQATLTLSLLVFNLLFAVENALDLTFLWSGAALPAGVTLADYAHRGAYLLIVTALLAGAFVLVAFRPGSVATRNPIVRALVVTWVVQNLLLVASSIHRTLDYIHAYQMTLLRIAALAWMGLVAVGLVLICWRLLAGRSARWLLNANAFAAVLTLTGASVIDFGAVTAAWNVRNAREGNRIDLCYLNTLGASALLPLIELERRAGGPRLRDRAVWLRDKALSGLRDQQSDWHSWTWRGARRLARADALLGPSPARPAPAPNGRSCDGAIRRPPPPSAVPVPNRLTGRTER